MKGRKPATRMDSNPLTEVLPAPDWMSTDAKAEWNRIMPALIQRRVLTEADLGGVENYCAAVAAARQCDRELQARNHVYVDERGNLKRNPASIAMKDALNSARLLAAELGLTPVSRSRPAVSAPADDDDLLD
jgi:P27 family predicted phage terminase small subunit